MSEDTEKVIIMVLFFFALMLGFVLLQNFGMLNSREKFFYKKQTNTEIQHYTQD